MTKFKEAYYFSHDANARNDERLIKLRAKYDWNGYGLYWAIVEKMREATKYKLEYNIQNIAYDLHYSVEKIQELLKDCFEWKLFTQKKGYFWSDSLIRRMKKLDDRRKEWSEAGKIGAKRRWHKSADKPIDKPIAVKEIKESKPTIDVITVYFKELNASTLEAQKFFDYFESNGWKIGGKAPMKNWKAAVRNWIRRLPVSSVRPKEVIVMPKREEVSAEGLKEIRKLVAGITNKE